MSERDTLFAEARTDLVDFAFDDKVASVFPDMLRRSIPGYETIISLLGVIAAKYAQDHSRIYDLGCSLGAATLSMHSQLKGRPIEYMAVDSSGAMIARCEEMLSSHLPQEKYQCLEQDVRQTPISNASVVTLNFTLQFLPVEERQNLLDSLYQRLNPGGALILSEKVSGATPAQDETLADLYYRFKACNGYSDLEISQKRNALERVMVLDSAETHLQRLRKAGFDRVDSWYSCLNFSAFLAVK